jgi:transcription initiation factor TFIIF subunit beta
MHNKNCFLFLIVFMRQGAYSMNGATSASDMEDNNGRIASLGHINEQGFSERSARALLNISQAQRKVWLVKLPDFLMERWMGMSHNATDEMDFGAVRIHEQAPNKPVHVTLHLPTDTRYQGIPKDYELNFMKNAKPNSVFSENALDGTAIDITGKVDQECLVKPIMNEEYRKLLKERVESSNRPKRSIQVLHQEQSDIQYGLLAPVKENVLLSKKRQKFSMEYKRERLPRADFLDLLFTAFERKTHWTLKGLLDYSHQPHTYLKELLQEIAIYHKKGHHKSTYELKPEYINTTARTAILEKAHTINISPDVGNYGFTREDMDDGSVDEDEEDMMEEEDI